MEPRRLGRYVVSEPIASGGMAIVSFGRLFGPNGFSRMVAIKELRPDLARESKFAKMLVSEARIAARIDHVNVVRTLDVISTETDLAIVMDYIHGDSLARLLARAMEAKASVPIAIAAAIVAGVLHGLHAAHEATAGDGSSLDIVHRDVSPQNVLVGVDGVARVLDFGIAKAAGHTLATKRQQIWGKLAYMAPEQVHVAPTDRRADVYAAGVILWEALTGRRLFEGAEPKATLKNVLTAFVDPPSALRAETPPALDAVVRRAVQRDPRKRFATAREMALALEASTRIAHASEIGPWVSELARPSLAARELKIATLEQIRSFWPEEDDRPVESSDEPVGGAAAGAATRVGSRGRSGRSITLGAAVISLGALAVFPRWGGGEERETPAGGSLGAPAVSAVASSSASAEPGAAAATLQVDEAMPDAPRAQGDHPRRGQRPPSRAPSTSECEPPFVFDALGHKHFKANCFPR